MRRALTWVGRGLFWLLIIPLLLPIVLPPFLDRIYYRGPPSGHFDGQRFFNPDGQFGTGGSQHGFSPARMLRFFTGADREAWPAEVPVTPGYPAAAGTPCPPLKPKQARENWARCMPAVDPARMFVTWIGHATVLVQAGGLTILTDPIWSEKAGPFNLVGPERVRQPGIRFDDLPKIDVVLVSHNHYDHMDLPTLKAVWERDRPLIVTSLGNDTILKGHGIEAVARDWGGRVPLKGGEVIVERVHHWGSRWGKDRNRALWSGFTVRTPAGAIFYAGDTGFGDGTWPVDAAWNGPFRLAIIPIGAFRPRQMMSGNHIGPEEAVEVFERLGRPTSLAMHWGTFQLSNEAIDEPRELLAATLRKRGVPADRFRTTEVGVTWEVPR